ncbi:hypothetical protein T492DRAFT_836919 [Pavlovales sp. CCMP2436]|nr:hypothetical protein T492DRAFT_836919 [Pavlovales sp. CCMP2436]
MLALLTPAKRARLLGPPPAEAAEEEEGQTRLVSADAKLVIVGAYSQWVKGGSLPEKLPIAELVAMYQVHRTYRKRLYEKMVASGSVENGWCTVGNPKFSPYCLDEQVMKVVREHRGRQKVASSSTISAAIKKPLKGKVAVGITTGYLAVVLKKVAVDARKILSPGKISLLHDKAPLYQGIMNGSDLCGFNELDMAAGKSPDMSHFDAGLCPFMEREVELAGAQTPDEIREAVKCAWEKVTPVICEKVPKRVRRNMKEVIKLKGGQLLLRKVT